MVTVVDIAEAVVAELNAAPAGTFNAPFEAVRAYLPSYDLKELSDLKVTVVPRAAKTDQAGRGLAQSELTVDIAVQNKPADLSNASVDPLMELVRRIGEFFRARRLGSLPAVWTQTANAPLYSDQHMIEFRAFTAVVSVTFKVVQ